MLNGVPTGVTVDFELDGVLEAVSDESPLDIEALETEMDCTNYLRSSTPISPTVGIRSVTPSRS